MIDLLEIKRYTKLLGNMYSTNIYQIGSSIIVFNAFSYIFIHLYLRGLLIYMVSNGLDIIQIYKDISQNVNYQRFESSQPIWLGVFFIQKNAFDHIGHKS